MLLFSILICVDHVYGSNENIKLKEVSVAYFYDKSYFGDKYDSPDKTGFGYEYLQAIGNFSGWKYRYVYGDYDTLLEQFMVGKIDVMPAISRDFDQEQYYENLIAKANNEETKREIEKNKINVLYPNQPMNSVDYYFCVPEEKKEDSVFISSYVKQKIAIPSIISPYINEWMDKIGLVCDIIEYENTAACINALNKQEVMAIIGERSVAESGLVVTKKVGSIDYYLGISSANRGLLKDVNNALDSIGSSTEGFLTSLQNSFDSTSELDKILTTGEISWLKNHETLKVGTLTDFQPFSYKDPETGLTTGFIYDAIPGILFNVDTEKDVKYFHYDTYNELLDALNSGEVDTIFPVSAYLYQSEINNYIYTNNIATTEMMIIYKNEFSEDNFASIAYPEGGMEQYYSEVNYGNSSMYEYNTASECLDAVINDEVNCAILRKDTCEKYIDSSNSYKKLNILSLPEEFKMGLGVKRGNTGLYTLLNRGVTLILQGRELNELSLASSSVFEERNKDTLLDFIRSETFIFIIIIMIMLVIIVMLALSMSKVLYANREIKKANDEIKGVAALQQQNFDIIAILTRDYSSVFKINLETEDMEVYRMDSDSNNRYASMLSKGAKFSDFFNQYVRDYVYEDDKPKMYDEITISVIRKKLRQRNSYAIRYRKLMNNSDPRYYEFRVSTVDIDINGKVQSIIISFIDCNDEILHELEYMKGLEKALKSDAVISGLTGDFDWVAYVANTESKDSDDTGVTHYRIGEMFLERFDNWANENNFNRMVNLMAEQLVISVDRKAFLKEMTKQHIRKYLIKDMAHFINFRVEKNGEWEYYQIKCVADIVDGKLFGFILGFHSVDDEIRKEKQQQEKLERMVADRTAELEEKNESLNRMNTDIIELMGNVVEGRDEDSGQHVKRVKNFTNIMANQVMKDYPEYDLTPELVNIITSASALHDVGKIMIPDNILLKPGRLTNEEYEIMKSHTVSGTEILKNMPADWDKTYMKTSMEICRYHHEKYDGKGYPDGLKGDDIPISAQIVSVADCYDALVSKRVYKDAFSCDEAFRMIQSGECGAFSPKLMKSFEKCKALFEEQVQKSKDE
ncbi:MAG: transporter substrate-binding domain-containing protein [Lachnospiraceae bacterium]|nr:transporter substrate-binding domain-containing protein [Lachnospiraceae bacterium]